MPSTTTRTGSDESGVLSRRATLDVVAAELTRAGMRMDRFLSLASEGLLPNEELRDLWRMHRDVLVPDWSA